MAKRNTDNSYVCVTAESKKIVQDQIGFADFLFAPGIPTEQIQKTSEPAKTHKGKAKGSPARQKQKGQTKDKQKNKAATKTEESPKDAEPEGKASREKDQHDERYGVPDNEIVEYVRSVSSVPQLTDEEHNELARIIHESKDPKEVQEAKQRMVSGTIRLVISIVKSFHRPPFVAVDLIQEGCLGLLRAIDKYDPTRENKFSTYATFWIRRAVSRALDEQTHLIRMPTYALIDGRKLRYTQQKILAEHNDYSEAQLLEAAAKELGMTPERALTIQRVMNDPTSIDTPIYSSDDHDVLLSDSLTDTSSETPESVTEDGEISDRIKEMLDCLDERERYIVVERYGLGKKGHGRLLEDIGKELHLSRERIRQIEAQAINKMRYSAPAAKLADILRQTGD